MQSSTSTSTSTENEHVTPTVCPDSHTHISSIDKKRKLNENTNEEHIPKILCSNKQSKAYIRQFINF